MGERKANLDGVGEGKTDFGSTQLLALGHSEHGNSQHQDGAIEIAEEGKPQVEGLSIEQSSVMVVGSQVSLLNEVALFVMLAFSVRQLIWFDGSLLFATSIHCFLLSC